MAGSNVTAAENLLDLLPVDLNSILESELFGDVALKVRSRGSLFALAAFAAFPHAL